jgi:hypothetical protein
VLEQFALKDYLQPESGFVGFFDDKSYLRNELWLASGPTRRTIICGDRSPRPQQLLSNFSGSGCMRQRVNQVNDPQGKMFGPSFQLFWCHNISPSNPFLENVTIAA